MLPKTITKFFAFVIVFAAICVIFSGCSAVFPTNNANTDYSAEKISPNYAKPQIVGKIESKEISESSGIAASKCQPNIFWTHNDSGDEAFIFALDEKGKKLGTWKVSGAKNYDWEDIAEIKNSNGECVLYIGDIGNNTRIRDEFAVYIVKEPTISADSESSSKKNPLSTEPSEAVKFVYPDMRRDAETLMVHPTSGDIYILSKRLSDASGVYKLKSDFDLNKINKLEKIADFTVPAIPNGFLTGGDISPDGKRAIFCDYFNAYEIVLPETAKIFDEIWKEKPLIVELGAREQGESVGYSADGKSIYATSEKRNSPLIEVKRK